jgi:O-glycosyl hydrolase
VHQGQYTTKCGFTAKVFITELTNVGQAIGAILIPNHPAAFPGWESCEWDLETGKCRTRQDVDSWDLIL